MSLFREYNGREFEFVTLHTPIGIGRDSRTFQILKEMTGQDVQSNVYRIAFSADGKFQGLCNVEDIYDQIRDTTDDVIRWNFNPEKQRQFFDKYVPQTPSE
jgi:hypothetical protein